MVSAESRATIDALSSEELEQEINLGRLSRFQGEKFAYVKTRRSELVARKSQAEKAETATERRRDFHLNSVGTWVAVVASVMSLVVGGGWYQEYQKNLHAENEANARLVAEDLQPIATLLADNNGMYNELSTERYAEPGWGILESFLVRIRRDGVAKHSVMKARIETLTGNNQTVLTLLTKYASYVRTESFKIESAKFRDHAIRYNDRWKALLEVYASVGDFPTAAPVFPAGFPAAVEAELKSRRGQL